MPDRTETYDRAVRRFLDLGEAPLRATFQSPRALARSCGLPPNTGYRATYAMESARLFRRDSSGAYLRGDLAARIGLSALGIGELAVAALPVLEQLRRDTSQTALLGRHDGATILVGPFAFGRGSQFVVPYGQRLEVLGHETGPSPFTMTLVRNGPEDHWLLALAIQATDPERQALVGLLGRADLTRPPADRQSALATAVERFAQTLGHGGDNGAPGAAVSETDPDV